MSSGVSIEKKILLIIHSLGGGGAERVMANIANYWSERGIEITLLTLDDPKSPDRYPTNSKIKRVVVYFPPTNNLLFKAFQHIKRIRQIRRVILTNMPDATLSFMTSTNILVILASIKTNVRCVVSERTDPSKHLQGKLWIWGQRYLYRLADLVVGQTAEVKLWLESNTKARVEIIPNFIRESCYSIRTPASKIIAVGRLRPEKGFDLLIQAFADVIKKHPEWRLVICGDGPEKSKLEALCVKFKVETKVDFLGYVENPRVVLSTAGIYVQPSRYEGFPNALLEAMSQGVPAIASHAAGNMLVENGVDGILVANENVANLSAAIARLIEQPEFRDILGQNARSIISRFSEEKIMTLWEAALFKNPAKL